MELQSLRALNVPSLELFALLVTKAQMKESDIRGSPPCHEISGMDQRLIACSVPAKPLFSSVNRVQASKFGAFMVDASDGIIVLCFQLLP